MPTGVDQFAAVVQAEDVHDSLYSLIADIQEEVQPPSDRGPWRTWR